MKKNTTGQKFIGISEKDIALSTPESDYDDWYYDDDEEEDDDEGYYDDEDEEDEGYY